MHNYSTRLAPTPYLLQSNIAQILGLLSQQIFNILKYCVQPPPPNPLIPLHSGYFKIAKESVLM